MGARALRVRSPWFGAGLLAGALVLHATTLRSYFMGDDFEAIADVTRDGPQLSWLSELGAGAHLRPVLWLNLWASHQAFGMDPLGWHLFNVAMHAVTAWLVALLADALLADGAWSAGAAGEAVGQRLRALVGPLAGVLFLVAPAHAEPVSWIVARVDLILTPLCLVSLLSWLRWRRVGGAWVWLSVATFALALYTKESVLSFPAVIVAYELWRPRHGLTRRWSLRRSASGLALYAVVTIAYLAHYLALDVRYLADEGNVLAADSPALTARRGLQVAARSVLPAMGTRAWWAALVVAVGLVVAAVVAWRRPGVRAAVSPQLGLLGFLVTAVVVTVAPVARLGVSLDTTAGERLAYLPSVFSIIALALGLGLLVELAPRVGPAVAVALVVLGALVLVVADGTYRRGGVLAEGVVASQARWPRDEPALVLLAPDTLEGAWVGRNAFGAALVLEHGWTEPQDYVELGTVTMSGVGDTISVSRGACERCVRLHLDDPDARIAWPTPEALPQRIDWLDATVTEVSDRDIEIDLGDELDPRAVWYVSGGRYRSLADALD